jgi:hypothetical protein
MRKRAVIIVLVILVPLLVGCSGGESSSTGETPSTSDASSTSEAQPEGEAPSTGGVATLSGSAQPIFDARCASQRCHGVERADLRLTSGVSYGELVNVASVQVPSLMRVLPSQPDSSYLLIKLADNPPQGVRMPIAQPPLEPEDVAAIRDWVESGAADN